MDHTNSLSFTDYESHECKVRTPNEKLERHKPPINVLHLSFLGFSSSPSQAYTVNTQRE